MCKKGEIFQENIEMQMKLVSQLTPSDDDSYDEDDESDEEDCLFARAAESHEEDGLRPPTRAELASCVPIPDALQFLFAEFSELQQIAVAADSQFDSLFEHFPAGDGVLDLLKFSEALMAAPPAAAPAALNMCAGSL